MNGFLNFPCLPTGAAAVEYKLMKTEAKSKGKNTFISRVKMKEAQQTARIAGLFVSRRIVLRTLQRDLMGGHLSIPSYQSSLFSSAGTFLCLLLPLTYDRPTITSGGLARACTRCSLSSAGSRRSFVFGLIGCIIWDTSSGVKPCEEAWEASALGWGMGAGHFSCLKYTQVHTQNHSTC